MSRAHNVAGALRAYVQGRDRVWEHARKRGAAGRPPSEIEFGRLPEPPKFRSRGGRGAGLPPRPGGLAGSWPAHEVLAPRGPRATSAATWRSGSDALCWPRRISCPGALRSSSRSPAAPTRWPCSTCCAGSASPGVCGWRPPTSTTGCGPGARTGRRGPPNSADSPGCRAGSAGLTRCAGGRRTTGPRVTPFSPLHGVARGRRGSRWGTSVTTTSRPCC